MTGRSASTSRTAYSPIQAKDGAFRGADKIKRPNGDQARDDTVRDMMASLDESVTSILDALREKIAQRTLVLFFSDNDAACATTTRRQGHGLEGGHRVPVAWWPGTIQGSKATRCAATST